MSAIGERVKVLTPDVLRGLMRGIEKEGLRIRADGTLADTPHPPGLGSALTHPRITTDFSESQLELITGVHTGIESCLAELEQLHQVVYREMGEELIWGASMPCKLPEDGKIPIARYGSSNIGRMKTLYRRALARRYGPRMQVISGIHYNFSLPEEAWPLLRNSTQDAAAPDRYRDQRYFALIRNFRRHSWLLLLLLGAAPAACGSFVAGRPHRLNAWGGGTVYAPGATSLRMGGLGYQSDAQASLAVSFNDLRGYAATLNRALTEPYPAYEAIGLRDGEEYLQLSTALLQIENEFYGTIRPKRTTRTGERPLRALGERGVEYVEVRCLDVDPFLPVGIAAESIRLLDVFLLHCLLADSPPDNPREIAAIGCNQRLVAEKGRDPQVRLARTDGLASPADWGAQLLEACEPIAEALDAAHATAAYGEVLACAQRALRDFDALPSARVLGETEQAHGRSFPAFGLAQSRKHRDGLCATPLPAQALERYAQLAARSREGQRGIEASDDVPFETFRRRYLEQELLCGAHFDLDS